MIEKVDCCMSTGIPRFAPLAITEPEGRTPVWKAVLKRVGENDG